MDRGLNLRIRDAGPGLSAGEPRGARASREADECEPSQAECGRGNRAESGTRTLTKHSRSPSELVGVDEDLLLHRRERSAHAT